MQLVYLALIAACWVTLGFTLAALLQPEPSIDLTGYEAHTAPHPNPEPHPARYPPNP